jgi:hypothetical protein
MPAGARPWIRVLSTGSVYSVTVPPTLTRPMTSAPTSVNQSAPSMPAAMRLVGLLVVYSVNAPEVVMAPT